MEIFCLTEVHGWHLASVHQGVMGLIRQSSLYNWIALPSAASLFEIHLFNNCQKVSSMKFGKLTIDSRIFYISEDDFLWKSRRTLYIIDGNEVQCSLYGAVDLGYSDGLISFSSGPCIFIISFLFTHNSTFFKGLEKISGK